MLKLTPNPKPQTCDPKLQALNCYRRATDPERLATGLTARAPIRKERRKGEPHRLTWTGQPGAALFTTASVAFHQRPPGTSPSQAGVFFVPTPLPKIIFGPLRATPKRSGVFRNSVQSARKARIASNASARPGAFHSQARALA